MYLCASYTLYKRYSASPPRPGSAGLGVSSNSNRTTTKVAWCQSSHCCLALPFGFVMFGRRIGTERSFSLCSALLCCVVYGPVRP